MIHWVNLIGFEEIWLEDEDETCGSNHESHAYKEDEIVLIAPERFEILFEWFSGSCWGKAVFNGGYFWIFLGFPLKKIAIRMWIAIMMIPSTNRNKNMSSFVDSFLIKNELRNMPSAWEARSAKMQTELTMKIWWRGNQIFANLLAVLMKKQSPTEQKKVPTYMK